MLLIIFKLYVNFKDKNDGIEKYIINVSNIFRIIEAVRNVNTLDDFEFLLITFKRCA